MNDVELAEGIYVKRSKGKFGAGATSRESVLETLWFPFKAENGFVELLLITADLQRVLGMMEKVPVDLFNEQYSVKDDTKDIYLRLKETLP